MTEKIGFESREVMLAFTMSCLGCSRAEAEAIWEGTSVTEACLLVEDANTDD